MATNIFYVCCCSFIWPVRIMTMTSGIGIMLTLEAVSQVALSEP